MLKKLLIIPLISGAFMLSGCNEEMPPKCDSKEAKALLSKVIHDTLTTEGFVHAKVSFTRHEMIDEHPEAKEYTCQARGIYKMEGKMESALINYSVFLDENKKGQFFLVVNDNAD